MKAPPISPIGSFIRGHILPAQICVGVFGNLTVLIILNAKGMRRGTTNFLLSAIAATNLFFFIIYLPEWIVMFNEVRNSLNFMKFYLYSYALRLMIENSLGAAAIWITVSVSIERVIAICYPLHARNLITKRRSFVAIVTIFIVAHLINVYVLILMQLDVSLR